jgi:hypothetical protein
VRERRRGRSRLQRGRGRGDLEASVAREPLLVVEMREVEVMEHVVVGRDVRRRLVHERDVLLELRGEFRAPQMILTIHVLRHGYEGSRHSLLLDRSPIDRLEKRVLLDLRDAFTSRISSGETDASGLVRVKESADQILEGDVDEVILRAGEETGGVAGEYQIDHFLHYVRPEGGLLSAEKMQQNTKRPEVRAFGVSVGR